MNLNDFHFMTSDLKAEAVWVHGTFLAVRSEEDYYVALYHMGSFFVEVWYSPQADKITYTIGFRNAVHLEPYLQMIDISELEAA